MDIDHELSEKVTSENHENADTPENIIQISSEDENEIADHKIETDNLKIDTKEVAINIEEVAEKSVMGGSSRKGNSMWVIFWGSGTPATAEQQESGWLCGYGSPNPPPGPQKLAYKPETRNSFVKTVMIIVLIMLLATAGFVGFVLMTPDVKDFFRQTKFWYLFIPAFIVLMIVDYGMACSPCTRKPPCNIFFLFLSVAATSVITSKITAHYKTEIVLYAILATAAVVVVCIFLACSKFDFTRWLLYIIVISTVFSVVTLIVLLVKLTTGVMMKPVIITIFVIATLIQSILLIMELQMVLGGKAVELNEQDYALGANMIYTSIIEVFLNLLGISGNM